MKKNSKIKPINLNNFHVGNNNIEIDVSEVKSILQSHNEPLPIGYVTCVGEICVECVHVWDGVLKKYVIVCKIMKFIKEVWL